MCEFKQQSGELYFPLGHISQYRAAEMESRVKMNNLKVTCCLFPSDGTVRVSDLELLELSSRLEAPVWLSPGRATGCIAAFQEPIPNQQQERKTLLFSHVSFREHASCCLDALIPK